MPSFSFCHQRREDSAEGRGAMCFERSGQTLWPPDFTGSSRRLVDAIAHEEDAIAGFDFDGDALVRTVGFKSERKVGVSQPFDCADPALDEIGRAHV